MKKLFWVSVILFIFSSCVSNQEGVDLAIEYYNVGNAFFEADQLKKAEEYYEKTLNIDADFHKARYNLINLEVKQSNFKSANKNINYLKKIDAMNPKIKKLEAYIRYSEGNIEESLKIYLEVYSDGVISEDVRLNIVKLYYQLGFYSEAAVLISELLVEEEDESLYQIAGLISEGEKNFEMAAEYYESYIELGGDSIDVLQRLNSIYTNANDNTNLKPILLLLVSQKDDDVKADSFFDLSKIALLYDNDFKLGYDYLLSAINAGFSSKDKAESLLSEPDLIEVEKIRQLFIEKKVID